MESSEIRRRARDTLQGNFLISILAGCVAASMSGLLTGTGINVSVRSNFGVQFNIGAPFGEGAQFFIILLLVFFCIALLISLVKCAIGGAIQLGYAQFLLKQQDQAAYSEKDLFSQFYRFKECFLQILLRGVYTFLWSLLLIVPGIIKSYSYAMTPFIMAENPNLTAKEAIKASKELMDGHKGALFILDLSFIGWEILAGLTFGTGHFIINPYKNTAYAVFYRSISKPTPLSDSTES